MRRSRWMLAAGLLLGATLAASCSAAAPPTDTTTQGTQSRANKGVVESSDKPRPGGKLVYGLLAETNGWNPATNQWAPSGLQVTHAIFDTLTAYDEQSGIRPFLAESYTHDDSFRTWTFTLRPGVKLHNGKPVNADVVVRNQNFLKQSPVTGPAYKYGAVERITKRDELTFVVELSKSSAVYPITFATQLGVVADPDWLESNDGLKPIGTGPFRFDSWEIDKKLLVTKNTDYWRRDADGVRLPYLDSIEFRVISDNNTRSNALLAKDIDVMQTSSGEQLRQFQQLDGYQVYSDPKGESREAFVMLNVAAPPFDDPDARRALAYATDKATVVDTVNGGFDEVANGPMAPSSPWFTPTDYPQHDPDQARALVAKVKAAHGGSFSFTVQGGTDNQNLPMLQVLQQQWAEYGIDVKIDMMEGAKVIIGVVTGSYQAVSWSQFDSPNPFADGVWWDADLATPPPSFSLNFARLADREINDALVAGAATDDLAKQKEAMGAIQKRLAADVPYIWISHQRMSLIATNRVVNLARYALPDGSTGLDIQQGAHAVAQIWLRT